MPTFPYFSQGTAKGRNIDDAVSTLHSSPLHSNLWVGELVLAKEQVLQLHRE